MCKVIIDGKTVEFEGSVLSNEALRPYRKTVGHITICDSVTEIGGFAFDGFHSMKSIEIPNSVKVIGGHAFRECKVLENITIPDSVISIGNLAFSRCKSLKGISIPHSVKRVGSRIFADCDNIKVEVKATGSVISRIVKDFPGRIITICNNGNEYSILNDEQGNMIVTTGYVDYSGGKLYRGYKFNGNLNPRDKELMYCFTTENRCLTYYSLNETKAKLSKLFIF